MASRRRTRSRSITGSISDVQKRLKYLEGRPSPSKLGNYSVKASNLAPRSVAADQLAVSAVTSLNVEEGAIGLREMGENSVDSSEIRENAVGTSELSIDAVYNENVNTDAIGLGEMADNSVDTAEIRSNAVGTDELGIDAVYNENVFVDAIGLGEMQDNSVDSAELRSNAVGTDELGIDAVYNENVFVDAIGLGEMQDNSVDAAEIRTNAVGTDEIALGAVKADEIDVDAVGLGEMADNSVDTAEIRSNAVGKDEIGTNAVESDEIALNAVGQGELANNSVDSDAIIGGAVLDRHIDSIGGISATKIKSGELAAERIPLIQNSKLAGNITVGKIASGTSIITNITPVSPVYESESTGTYGVTSTIGVSVGTGSNQVASGNHTHTGGSIPAHSHSFTGGSVLTASGSLSGHSHLGRDGSHLHGVQISGIVGGVTTSSKRFKEEISDYEIDPKKILQLKLKRYKYKDLVRDDQNTLNREWMYGYIAEEVLDTGVEEIVAYNEKQEPIALNYALLSTLVVELLKTQQAEIDFLKEEVQRLKDAK
jgi:hypothetical protein